MPPRIRASPTPYRVQFPWCADWTRPPHDAPDPALFTTESRAAPRYGLVKRRTAVLYGRTCHTDL